VTATGSGKRRERPAEDGPVEPGAAEPGAAEPAAASSATGTSKATGKSGGTGTNGARSESARPPYEKARDELTDLVKRLEAGGLTLEQSLELWERGERLAAICEEWLEGARARLATAMARRDEAPAAPGTPF
jgi:exodeoxyribonuclease VII small subunit